MSHRGKLASFPLTHDTLATMLRQIRKGQSGEVLGMPVARSAEGLSYAIANGEPRMLLAAIDDLMARSGRRAA